MSEHTPGPWMWDGVSLVQSANGNQILWPFNIPSIIEEDTPRYIKMGCAHADTSAAAEANAALIASAPDMFSEIERLRARVAELETDRDRWKAEALAARPFIDMGRIEAWQPDGFHPGIPPHIEYKAARTANGEVPHD